MPFFGNKFSPKKTPTRRKSIGVSEEIDDLVSEKRTVYLKLNEQKFVFENGEWSPETGVNSAAHKSNKRLRKTVQNIQEENNLLKLKYEIILDMITQMKAENHEQKEIDVTHKGKGNKTRT